MAVFSNEVIEARFINEGNTTIEVLYNIGKEIHSYVLEHDEDSEDFKDLVKDGWNIEKILNDTAEYKKNSEVVINNLIDYRISQGNKKIQANHKNELSKLGIKNKEDLDRMELEYANEYGKFLSKFHTEVLNNNSNGDVLFKFKLTLFEMNVVKKGDRKFQKRLRVAKSIIECYAILNEVYVEKE